MSDIQKVKEKPQKGKAIVFGGSGAVGQCLVEMLCKSDDWEQVLLIDKEKPKSELILKSPKYKLIRVPSLNKLYENYKWNFKGYNTVFSCLTGNILRSHEIKLVAHDYCIQTAVLANIYNVPNFSFLSIKAAHPIDSWYAECRLKGQVEFLLKEMNFDTLSIFRPGILTERPNPDFFESVLNNFLGLIPLILLVLLSLLYDDTLNLKNPVKEDFIQCFEYENDELKGKDIKQNQIKQPRNTIKYEPKPISNTLTDKVKALDTSKFEKYNYQQALLFGNKFRVFQKINKNIQPIEDQDELKNFDNKLIKKFVIQSSLKGVFNKIFKRKQNYSQGSLQSHIV